MSPIILVDGSSYLFRAYHALPNLTNKKGFPTSAIFGVLNMLRKLKEDFKPEQILVIFDAKGKNFRHTLYPDYKANRLSMPEDLAVQIAPLHELIKLLGFPLYAKSGVEADDVIGILAEKFSQEKRDVLIISSDKDLAQLLHPHVKMIDTMKNVEINEAYLMEKFGVPSSKIIDFLALTGDTSDNIPGIPGVGPKTAAKWLTEFGSLDEIIAHHFQIGGKVGEVLAAHLDQIPLSKQLVTIKRDCELHDLPTLHLNEPHISQLLPLLDEYNLDAVRKSLNHISTPEITLHHQNHHLILDEALFKNFLKQLQAEPYFAFNTETDGEDPLQASLLGLSFSFKEGEVHFIEIASYVLPALAPIFADPLIGKIAHNAKFDIKVLHHQGLVVEGLLFDTLLAAYILNQPLKQRQPVDLTWQDYETLRLKLDEDLPLKQVFQTIEMPLLTVLITMEEYGVLVDAAALQALSQKWGERLHTIAEEIFHETNMRFNLGSPKQLIEVLYHQLKLPITQKTPKGEPSTNEAALHDLAHLHVIPKMILEHRHLSKLKNTYTDKLPTLINPQTGRIHTQYQQATVATGRLSSIDPNLQNIPFKTDQGKEIRKAFIAPQGFLLVSADYSQVELRIMAHLSRDAALIEAFHQGRDIHRATAAEVMGIPEDQVTSDQRRHAKAVNFGLIYGMSAFGLAKQLEISRREADLYIERYFKRYPGVLKYMEATREGAHTQGYVETLAGRRLYLTKINSKNVMERKGAERAAINAPMQGTAADIIKKAMIAFAEFLRIHPELNAHLIMQVHDELVVEVREDQAEFLAQELKTIMEAAAQLNVPLIVDLELGKSWG